LWGTSVAASAFAPIGPDAGEVAAARRASSAFASCVLVVAAALAVATFSGTARAQDRPDGTDTARGVALGTGARASAAATSAVAYNPANLALARLYHVESALAYDPRAGRFGLVAAIVDSTTSPVAAGLSFRGIVGGDTSGFSGYDGRLALGFALSDAVSLGVTGRYLSVDRVGQLPEGTHRRLARGFTFDAALRVTPWTGLHLAALATNVLDLESPIAPLQVGGGASYTFGGAVTIAADVLVDLSRGVEGAPLTVGGGVEWLTGGHVPLRVGYAWDQQRNLHVVSGGLGYVDQKVGLDLSLRQDVSGGRDTQLFASFRYFVR
jgi:hypothetical protein